MIPLLYTSATASRDEIHLHLMKCDSHFSPPLSSRVNLLEYSDKLFAKAVSFEAWDEGILVGMVNAYLNSSETRHGYITNVSILEEYKGKGIASSLLKMCLAYAREHEYNRITLEVSSENFPAIKLYSKSGFKVTQKCGDSLMMEYEITGNGAEKIQDSRDYNSESKDTPDHKYAYNFDFDVMHPFMIRAFHPFLKKGNCLELGSFKGDFTKRLLPFFDDITCVEASDEAIHEARRRLGDRVTYVHSLFENAQLPAKYENIILTHVLEHLDDPIALLRKINDEWLTDEGRLFLVCPNANAPSRQIAVKMGIISHNYAVSKAEAQHGHRITYSFDTLERDARQGGLGVIHRSGIFFKALANFQWDRLLETDIISREYLDACYEFGQQHPDLCSSIFLVCGKGQKKIG
jgi:2-polyprenyl-3-methyl-5-hydroxy-6-metoxy-1,4-benzoquinol methylase